MLLTLSYVACLKQGRFGSLLEMMILLLYLIFIDTGTLFSLCK